MLLSVRQSQVCVGRVATLLCLYSQEVLLTFLLLYFAFVNTQVSYMEYEWWFARNLLKKINLSACTL